MIDLNQRNWHLKLIDALWESRLTPKDSTGISPYTLVYGKEARMPINLELNALTYVVNIEDVEEVSPLHRRYNQLMKLEEQRVEALKKMNQRQQTIKKYFDQGATTKYFQKGNWYYYGTKQRKILLCIQNLKHYGLALILLKKSWVIILIFSGT
jgi:hypothetical protein